MKPLAYRIEGGEFDFYGVAAGPAPPEGDVSVVRERLDGLTMRKKCAGRVKGEIYMVEKASAMGKAGAET